MKYRSLILILGCLLCMLSSATAQERMEKRYSIFFRVGKTEVDLSYLENAHVVETMVNDIQATLEADHFTPDSLLIYASASPEGSYLLNVNLARNRALAAKAYILRVLPELQKTNIKVESRPNDWSGLIQTLRSDLSIPYHDEILEILTDPSVVDKEAALRQRPEIYNYIRDHFLHKMRTATVTIRVIGKVDEFTAETTPVYAEPALEEKQDVMSMDVTDSVDVANEGMKIVEEPAPATETASETASAKERKPFYMGIKNNMIYDLAAVPNLGAEFYLGGDFSIAGNWMYSWWKSDPKAWYWRTYGGDLTVRYWFGKAAEKKPLQGHHVGLYGQILTYDFEVGNKGILADRWSWSAGVEYGYSLPVARRLNIDFTLGAGYHTGQFYEYLPIDGHYVWQATKNRVFIGPTKLEISLVWLLGYGNENENKGGK